MSIPLHVLIIEDRVEDAQLSIHQLRRSGYAPVWHRVETEEDYLAHLGGSLDIILADYALPQFDALRALRLRNEHKPDVPFIVVTGVLGDELAAKCIKHGANDYLLKDRLARLGPAVKHAIEQKCLQAEKRLAEQAMFQAQKQESLSVLASGVAHDFNNLLSVVLTQASVALYKLEPDHQARASVLQLKSAAKHASKLTRQLLAYSGQAPFEISSVNLNDVVKNNFHLFRASIPSNVELLHDLTEPLAPIEADRAQIQQIVMNLILNAAEAIGHLDGRIEIVTYVQHVKDIGRSHWKFVSNKLAPGDYVIMEVHDNGCGISSDTITRIFDPFFTTKSFGSGLGLAAVLGIMHAHGGAIKVFSEKNKGTTFKLYFPAATEI